MTTMDFALNQKTSPQLGFQAFLDLAARLGCVGVEPRNDLGRPFFDGIAPSRAGAMARERGLRLIGLSEVYPFNDWTDERRDAVALVIEAAAESGASTVSLIPRVDRRDPNRAREEASLRDALAKVLPMLEGAGVVGLIEPIGFSTSSVKFQREATQAIDALGAGDRLGIVHDTFQHALAGDKDIMTGHIRIVHISGAAGASRTGGLTDALDAERGLVDDGDETGAVGQIERLRSSGYRGAFSFECTAASVHKVVDAEAAIRASIDFVRGRLGV